MKKWNIVKLNDICDVITCGVAKRPEYCENGIPFLSSLNVKENRILLKSYKFISEKDHIVLTRYNKPEKGDILYTRVGSFGEAAVVDLDFEFSIFVSLTLIKPKHNIIDSRFLMWYLNSPEVRAFANNNTSGIGVQNLNVGVVREYQIPLPPLSIQQEIATLLDKADALRRKDRELLQAYEALAQAIFMDMFGDPVTNEKGWEVKKLGEVCNKITDGTHFSPPNQANGIPYITAKHVRKDKVDFYLNPTYISEEHHKEIYSRCTPVKGDVLYIKDGATTGVAAVNEYDFEFSMLSSLALIKPNLKILNNYYLVAWLNNETIKESYIRNYMAGAAIRRFTLDKLKRFELLVPPIELQNSFELTIKNLLEQKERLSRSDSESLFQTLLQRSFSPPT